MKVTNQMTLNENESFVGIFSVGNHTASGLKDFILIFFNNNTDLKNNAEVYLMTARL